jgi:integrase/recombinase XerD
MEACHSWPGLTPKTRRLLERFEEDLRLRVSERTGPEYLSQLKAFVQWLDVRHVKLLDVRSGDIQAHQSDLLAGRRSDGRPYSAGHQVNRLKAIKRLYRFLHAQGHLLHDPSARIEFPRTERALPRSILTLGEVRRMLLVPRGRSPLALRDRAILETLYATGIRATELANVGPHDVDTEERVLRVVRGKGKKDRVVPLTRAAAAAIEVYLQQGRAQLRPSPRCERRLFVADKGGPLDRSVLSRLMRRWARAAKLKKRVTCHTFRHTVATHLLRGRADIRHIQALLGHEWLGTTERYTRVEISDLKQVIRRAHPRGR